MRAYLLFMASTTPLDGCVINNRQVSDCGPWQYCTAVSLPTCATFFGILPSKNFTIPRSHANHRHGSSWHGYEYFESHFNTALLQFYRHYICENGPTLNTIAGKDCYQQEKTGKEATIASVYFLKKTLLLYCWNEVSILYLSSKRYERSLALKSLAYTAP